MVSIYDLTTVETDRPAPRKTDMNTSTFRTDSMEQVTYTHPDFPGVKALATRFTGSRRWAVVGFGSTGYTAHCVNGPRDWFTKTDAAEMAALFVTRGREFL